MRNLEIAAVFNQIADLLEIQGANPFRVRAYRRGAASLESLTDNIEAIVQQGAVRNISGIGEDLEKKIVEYLQSGRMEFHEQLKHEVPLGLVKMVEIPSVGPKTAKQIYDQFRIQTNEELEALCRTDSLLGVPGFKKKTIENILRGIELYRRRRGNYLLGKAVPIATQICRYLEPHAERVSYAGSLRRMKEVVHDIDILAASTSTAPAPTRRTYSKNSACRSFRPSCVKTREKWRRRPRASFQTSSSCRTFRAIFTCTRLGAMESTRRRK